MHTFYNPGKGIFLGSMSNCCGPNKHNNGAYLPRVDRAALAANKRR
jgi:hypothetical protein